jgi:LacI family transcriptional regulator
MAKTKKIALLFDTSNGFDRALLRGIVKYSRIHGPWVFSIQTVEKNIQLKDLKKWGMHGIIMRQAQNQHHPIDLPLPTVILPAEDLIPDAGNIVGDSLAMGKMGAEHLLNCGFKHFAFCGFKDMPWSRARQKGFKDRLNEEGFTLTPYDQPRLKTQKQWESEQRQLAKWLTSIEKPIGIMACNDERARNVINACKSANLNIPDQVAVLGINNDDLVCELSEPPLSSIAVSAERAGYDAANLLDKMMAGERIDSKTVLVEPLYVVTRNSTDILAVSDKDLSDALQFIKLHCKEPIQVSDVVNAVPTSRRVLEKRFRKILGRSMHDEIRRLRVEHAAWMLVETSLSISQISYAMGFPSPEKMSRYFKTAVNKSPLAYRTQYGNK